jgi:hypothetical protein
MSRESGPEERRAASDCSRCQLAETLEGGACGSPGEVEFRGLLLCRPHAARLAAEDMVVLVNGIVGSLELCSRSTRVRDNERLVQLVRTYLTETFVDAHEDLQRVKQEIEIHS